MMTDKVETPKASGETGPTPNSFVAFCVAAMAVGGPVIAYKKAENALNKVLDDVLDDVFDIGM